MMAVSWGQARHLLQAPWQWRRNDGSWWALRLYAALAVLLLVLPAGAALWWMPPPAAAVAVGVLAGLALTLVWGVQLNALLRLDHPRAAHTVPGHARALRVVALGLWLTMVILSGLAASLGAWLLGAAAVRTGLAVALGSATLWLVLALAMRWWWLWVPLSVGPSLMGVAAWRRLELDAWAWAQQHWLAQPFGLTLAALLLLGLCLPAVFGDGDSRHARAYAARERLRKIAAAGAAGNKPALAAYGRWGEWLGQPWQRLSDAWLARVCRLAQPTPRSVMARAEIVLHGPQHWVRFLSTGLLVQAVVAACLLATVRLAGVRLQGLLDGGHVGISIGLTSMALSAVMSLPAALWHSRREQALLVLLPGMPQGVAQSRAVAWRQLRQGLWTWAVILPALATMVWAGHGKSLLTYLAVALPVSAWMWRDASRLHEARPAAAMGPMLLCLVAGGLSAFLLSRWPAALLPWLLVVLGLTGGLLAWRWRRMAELPQALPAGRLG